MVRVYYVKGLDPNGHVVELAKFFRHEHAQQHVERIPRVSAGASYREVGVTIAEEREEDQHVAHGGGPRNALGKPQSGITPAWE